MRTALLSVEVMTFGWSASEFGRASQGVEETNSLILAWSGIQGWKGMVMGLYGMVPRKYQVIKLQCDIVEPPKVQWSNVREHSS